MKHSLNFLLSFLLCCAITANGQQTRGLSVPKPADNSTAAGNTYALIVGVSKYKNPAIPQLQYADKDAMAFRNYLVATGVDSNNITLLLNEDAKFSAVMLSINDLTDKAVKGDRVFIYFSGHGDVEKKLVTNDAYLLPYDAPKIVYSICAINVNIMQGYISTFSAHGVEAIVITDACHSGNLAGGLAGLKNFSDVLKTQWKDEVKILSCQPGELSLEGKQWGGGRGLFSYELIRGMAGAADKNGDGIISLQELSRFLGNAVPDEANPQNQNPILSAGNMSETISMANPDYLNKYTAGTNTSLIAAVDLKGFPETSFKTLPDTIQYNYKMFKAALDTGNYLAGKKVFVNQHWEAVLFPCAYYYFIRVPENEQTSLLISLMKRELCSVIVNDADIVLGNIIQNHPPSYDQAIKLQYGMRMVRNFLGDSKLKDIDFSSKFYIFETGVDLFYGGNFSGIKQDIQKLDTAIAISPSAAFLYFLKGSFEEQIHDYPASIAHLKKTIEISPKYLYPYNSLGRIYRRNELFDSSIATYKNLMLNLPDQAVDAYCHIYTDYSCMQNADSANYYFNVLEKIKDTSTDVRKKYISGEINYNFYATNRDISEKYYILKQYEKAISFNLKALDYAQEKEAYYDLACDYSLTDDKENAIKYLDLAIKSGYNKYGNIRQDTDLANIHRTPEFKALMKKYFPNEYKE